MWALIRKRLPMTPLTRYFGLLGEEPSPLALRKRTDGKDVRIADGKRDALLKLIEHLPLPALAAVLESGHEWDRFRALRMSDSEIRAALGDHLRHRQQIEERRTTFHRRRVIAGICIIAAGVWALAIGAFAR